MVVRIRFRRGPRIERRRGKSRLALFAASLFTLASVICFALGIWRLGTDLGWTGPFMIDDGLFSHLYVWLAGAGVLQFLSWKLTKYGRVYEALATETTPEQVLPEQVIVRM